MCQQPVCRCGFDSCLNGGVFMASTCSCVCPAQYTGQRCNSLITTTPQTTTTTTTRNPCAQQLPCLNGAKQSAVTCRCECKSY
jgi:hypothetical protein